MEELLEYINASQADFEWKFMEFGHDPQTTFWADFTIADAFGEQGIRETYDRVMSEWNIYPQYMGELTVVLNWKLWTYYELGNRELALVYEELWENCQDICWEIFTGDDARIYWEITD